MLCQFLCAKEVRICNIQRLLTTRLLDVHSVRVVLPRLACSAGGGEVVDIHREWLGELEAET